MELPLPAPLESSRLDHPGPLHHGEHPGNTAREPIQGTYILYAPLGRGWVGEKGSRRLSQHGYLTLVTSYLCRASLSTCVRLGIVTSFLFVWLEATIP